MSAAAALVDRYSAGRRLTVSAWTLLLVLALQADHDGYAQVSDERLVQLTGFADLVPACRELEEAGVLRRLDAEEPPVYLLGNGAEA